MSVFEYIALATFFLTIFLLFWLLKVIAEQGQSIPTKREKPPSQPRKIDYSQTERERELWGELGKLVYGDYALAGRLVEQVRKDYPGRSIEWYIQKAIRDLEWDRSR